VYRGELFNPVNEDAGVFVDSITVITQNQIVVSEPDGKTTFVTLHGVGDQIDPQQLPLAIAFLQSLGQRGRLFKAEEDCDVTVNGVTLVPGQILTESGESFAEELLLAGFGQALGQDRCDSDLVESCFFGLAAEGQANNPNPN
jgi:hypothetical protein